jgi:hypothetical protein
MFDAEHRHQPISEMLGEITDKAYRTGIDSLSDKEFQLYILDWQNKLFVELLVKSTMLGMPKSKREVVFKIAVPSISMGAGATAFILLVQLITGLLA